MPVTLEKPKTQPTIRQAPQRGTQHNELTPRSRHDQPSARTRKRQRAAPPTARRSTAPGRQIIANSHVQQQPQTPRVNRPREWKQTSKLRRFMWPLTLEKCFTLMGFGAGFMLLALCAFDLATAWPFMKASVAADVMFMLSGVAMLLASWNVAEDQIRG